MASATAPLYAQLNGQPFFVGIIFLISILQCGHTCQSGSPLLQMPPASTSALLFALGPPLMAISFFVQVPACSPFGCTELSSLWEE